MLKEAEEMRESDQKNKEAVQAKIDAETLGYQVEKQLTDLKEKLSKEDAEELKKKMDELRAYMSQDDVDGDELKEKTKALQELSWKATQSVYQQGDSGNADAGGDKTEDKKEESKDDKKEEKEKK
jgi:molecular chaperone DnaK